MPEEVPQLSLIHILKKNLKDVPLDREGMILITGETKAAGGEQE